MATKSKQYWLVKSEPAKYAWDALVRDGQTVWDGVRNYQARNNLQAMRKGDQALYYHSNEGKEIVGVAKVVKTAYQDPTTDDERWVAVVLAPVKKLKKPVTLERIKQDERLREIGLIRQSRLSVMPVTEDEFHVVLALAK